MCHGVANCEQATETLTAAGFMELLPTSNCSDLKPILFLSMVFNGMSNRFMPVCLYAHVISYLGVFFAGGASEAGWRVEYLEMPRETHISSPNVYKVFSRIEFHFLPPRQTLSTPERVCRVETRGHSQEGLGFTGVGFRV